jgi:hypothetical protein
LLRAEQKKFSAHSSPFALQRLFSAILLLLILYSVIL